MCNSTWWTGPTTRRAANRFINSGDVCHDVSALSFTGKHRHQRASITTDEISTCGGRLRLGLLERRRTRTHVNMGSGTGPVDSVSGTEPNSAEPDRGQEIKADLARQEQASLDVLDEALAAYQHGLAPASASIETAVNAAVVASEFTTAEADLHREVLLGLAHKYAQPGERVLGVGLMPYFASAEVVMVLTHGFAVKTRSRSYRIELDQETPTTTRRVQSVVATSL